MVPREGVRLARRCWLPEAQAESLTGRCLAVLESCAEDTVVSARTAARLHGLWLPEGDDTIHVATATPARAAKAMTRTKRPEFCAHRHALATVDRCVVGGVAAMTVARTWLDLARTLRLPDLVAAGDSAVRSGCPVPRLQEVVDRSRHVPGVRAARAALPLIDGRSRSRPETHLRLALRASDLPVFAVNEAIHRGDGRGWLAEPDLSLAEAKIAIEYIGEPHANIGRRRKDISRTVDMRREHWLVLEFGAPEVFGAPWEIAPEVRGHIRVRAPHLLDQARATTPPR